MPRDSEIRGVRDARVATVKLLCLQIHGVSFKKKRHDVNSKRHCCLAWFYSTMASWVEGRGAIKHNLHVYIALFTVYALADAFIQRFTVKELARVHCSAARHTRCSAEIKIATLKVTISRIFMSSESYK